ncbi:MAG: hypothetical protein NTW05_07595, partial [Pseudonocardiales bacterium]|nr:hypothetical protein [Pseudonocardiales bacterium]
MIGPAVRLGWSLAWRPVAVARRGAGVAAELLRIGTDGRGEPQTRGRRAVRAAADGLVDDAAL